MGLIWLPIDITALLRKSTGQGLAMATGAWIQSSWLINGTACTYSKLFSLAVKLSAWLYDWAFIAHCYSPSPCLQWNASGVYTPHRGLSVIASAEWGSVHLWAAAILTPRDMTSHHVCCYGNTCCVDQYICGRQVSSHHVCCYGNMCCVAISTSVGGSYPWMSCNSSYVMYMHMIL